MGHFWALVHKKVPHAGGGMRDWHKGFKSSNYCLAAQASILVSSTASGIEPSFSSSS